MCGIAGIWGRVSERRLRRMTSRLSHRGPDDERWWIRGMGVRSNDRSNAGTAGQSTLGENEHDQRMAEQPTIGFGHRRLAIIDCDGGRQPMSSGGSTVCFNGAIYNFEELREAHASRGFAFRTRSDTETILSSYELSGGDAGFIRELRGMYAFALWDEHRQRLWLARDPVGKKPLFYTVCSGEFLFASEIAALISALDQAPSVSSRAIRDYLGWGCIPGPGTIYEGVYTLRPGEILLLEQGSIVHRELVTPWNDADGSVNFESEEEIVAALRESVRIRMRADVPVGAFLSG
ncbi:MAG: asparagine synthetase B family protein, partial [Phycisphaerae bacterium]